MRRTHTAHARSRRPSSRRGPSVAVGVLAMVLTGCGSTAPAEGPPLEGDLVTGAAPAELSRFTKELAEAGRVAYYLGPKAAGYEFVGIVKIDNQGPLTSIEANYGPCDPGSEGYCVEPAFVSTQDWEHLPTGFPCTRVEPRLSVPTAVIGGQLHLFSARLQIKIVDDADLDGPSPGVNHALALVSQLRALDGTTPLDRLTPPTPEIAAWLDQTCPGP